jgi:NADH-quinone oxidoreductase subunit A
MQNPIISEFGFVVLSIIAALAVLGLILFGVSFIRPNKPNFEKLTTYESGEEPIGDAVIQFNARYYVIALIFLLFEVEVIFIFPWATVFGQKQLDVVSNGNWYWFATFEMLIFIGILALGLAYVWVKGHLDWAVLDKNVKENFEEELEEYKNINEKYSTKK